MVKITCYCRKLGVFGSQHLHGSQQYVTPISGDLAFFLTPWTPGMHVLHVHTQRQNRHIHKLK